MQAVLVIMNALENRILRPGIKSARAPAMIAVPKVSPIPLSVFPFTDRMTRAVVAGIPD